MSKMNGIATILISVLAVSAGTGTAMPDNVIPDGVTCQKLQSYPVGLPAVGRLQPALPSVDKESWWSVGCETLDRGYSVFDDYKHLVSQTCAGYVRLQSGWGQTEKVRGQYDFTWLDEQVDYLLSQGVKPWLCLCYGNTLYLEDYGPADDVKHYPRKNNETMAGWCRYVDAVVKHFQGRVSMFELWNEPDLRKALTVADYSVFLKHTVRAVKQADPHAKVAAGVVSRPESPYIVEALRLLDNEGLAKQIDYVTFHAYFPNPDMIGDVAVELREKLRRYNPGIEVLQGEAGCPSIPMFDGGFSSREWDEVAQVKWDTRQMLTCFRSSIPSSVFTMVDYVYQSYFITYGMVKLDLQRRPVYLKPKFHGVRNIAGVVTADHSPSDKVKVLNADCEEEVTVIGLDKENRTVGYFLWFGGDVPSKHMERKNVTLDVVGARLKDPVYVDILTGKVYSLKGLLYRGTVVGDRTHFSGLPLWDAPILIIESDEIVIHKNR